MIVKVAFFISFWRPTFSKFDKFFLASTCNPQYKHEGPNVRKVGEKVSPSPAGEEMDNFSDLISNL